MAEVAIADGVNSGRRIAESGGTSPGNVILLDPDLQTGIGVTPVDV